MNARQMRRRCAAYAVPVAIFFALLLCADRPRTSHAASPEQLAPAELLERALQQCNTINDYACRFTKCERMNGRLKKPEVIDVRVRVAPLSIYMQWVENPGKIRRAVYVQGRNVGDEGQERVLVEPNGLLARAVAPRVKLELRGERARKASRYTIDEYVFRAMLQRIITQSSGATGAEFAWRPVRGGTIDGRDTFVLECVRESSTPTDAESPAVLIVHLDRQRLVPLMLQAYADPQREVLVEEYRCEDLRLNPGLGDADFQL